MLEQIVPQAKELPDADRQKLEAAIAELRKDPDPWIKEYFSGARGRAALAQA